MTDGAARKQHLNYSAGRSNQSKITQYIGALATLSTCKRMTDNTTHKLL